MQDDGRVSTAAFMAELERQEQQRRRQDIVSKRLLTSTELQTRLNMSAEAFRAALEARRLFALRGPACEDVYPAFFADPAYDRRVLNKVSEALGDMSGEAKLDFLMSPRMSLCGRSPLEAIATAAFDAVLNAAHAFKDE